MRRLLMVSAIAAGTCLLGSAGDAEASSHREAPFITKNPKVDSTDFYMFRSYETGKENTVTIIANYLPLQDAYGGPNYFQLDPEALYEIHIDNDGDGGEDITFQFQFKNALTPAGTGLQVPVVLAGAAGPTTKMNNVPLLNIGGVTFADNSKLQVQETFAMNVVTGDRRTGAQVAVTPASFKKPFDFTGTGTFGSVANYKTYAESHIAPFGFGSCTGARVFAGQRREGFAGNIGPIFDLLQAGATGANGEATKAQFLAAITGGDTEAKRGRMANVFDTGLLYDKNVTSIAIEVPISCLTKQGGNPVIGGWTSASMRQAPKKVRTDLVAAFATGLTVTTVANAKVNFTQTSTFAGAGITAPPGPAVPEAVAEYLRLNTAFPAMPTTAAAQAAIPTSHRGLGALGCFTADRKVDPGLPTCDLSGFPNGRRPGDDVLDITLRVAEGVLFPTDADAPLRSVPFTDGNYNGVEQFDTKFPYLRTPLGGNLTPLMQP